MPPEEVSTPPLLKDERIYKLKMQANEEYKNMQQAIASIEELVRMFNDNVLAFHTTSLRYSEVLSRLLVETEPPPDKPTI